MPKKPRSGKWVKAGFVGVGSGSIVIMDAIDAMYGGRDAIQEWSDDLDRLPRSSPRLIANFHRVKYSLGQGIESEALVSRTGYGDGNYRIWARLNEEGRVMELRILFDTSFGYDDGTKAMHDISQAEIMRKLVERDQT